MFAGDRLNLRSCWRRGSRQSEGSEPGASVRQHGLRQGRRHQPRGVHGLLQHQHPRAGQPRRPPLSHPQATLLSPGLEASKCNKELQKGGI